MWNKTSERFLPRISAKYISVKISIRKRLLIHGNAIYVQNDSTAISFHKCNTKQISWIVLLLVCSVDSEFSLFSDKALICSSSMEMCLQFT